MARCYHLFFCITTIIFILFILIFTRGSISFIFIIPYAMFWRVIFITCSPGYIRVDNTTTTIFQRFNFNLCIIGICTINLLDQSDERSSPPSPQHHHKTTPSHSYAFISTSVSGEPQDVLPWVSIFSSSLSCSGNGRVKETQLFI